MELGKKPGITPPGIGQKVEPKPEEKTMFTPGGTPVAEEKVEPKPAKIVPEIKMARYDDIESKIQRAIEIKDFDTVMLLNELTLARNIDSMSAKELKHFGIVFVAFKADGRVLKRAGVYNTDRIKSSEEAEDILISEDFTNQDIFAIPRDSVFTKKF